MAECTHPRADRIYHHDGRRQCGRCASVLPAEAPTTETTSLVGWPVPPRGGTKWEDYQATERMRSEAKRARYIRDHLPVNLVLIEAWADD